MRPHRNIFLRRLVQAAFDDDLVSWSGAHSTLPVGVEAADDTYARLQHHDLGVATRLHMDAGAPRFDAARNPLRDAVARRGRGEPAVRSVVTGRGDVDHVG